MILINQANLYLNRVVSRLYANRVVTTQNIIFNDLTVMVSVSVTDCLGMPS